jgi:dTDP-4-dehydrorhamnose reductase
MTHKILLIGKNGQVGADLALTLPQLGEVFAVDRQGLNLSNPVQIRDTIRAIHPTIIVNAAAYTAVEQAESDEAAAHIVNAEAPRIMAEEAKKIGAILVHYSTDYVFDGTKRNPYVEEDPPNPLNAYGRTKLAGEQAIQQVNPPHLIFRTAWVYSTHGKNFLLTILRLASQREELRIVRDQIGAPTSSREIAMATSRVLAKIVDTLTPDARRPSRTPGGVYHLTAAGETSWSEFAASILSEASKRIPTPQWQIEATGGALLIARRVIPITTAEFPTRAVRPAYSVLSNERLARLFGVRLADWRDELISTFERETHE